MSEDGETLTDEDARILWEAIGAQSSSLVTVRAVERIEGVRRMCHPRRRRGGCRVRPHHRPPHQRPVAHRHLCPPLYDHGGGHGGRPDRHHRAVRGALGDVTGDANLLVGCQRQHGGKREQFVGRLDHITLTVQ